MAFKTTRWRAMGLAAILLSGSALVGVDVLSAQAQPVPDATPAAAGPIQPSGVAHPLPDFSDLAAQVSPAVVSAGAERGAGR